MSNRRRTTKTPKPRTRSELRATAASRRQPRMIPLVWLSSVIGFFLLAPAWISTLTFFTCFRRVAVHHHFWVTEEFWFFGMGAVLWIIVFFSACRAPLLIYVFGHELTHALWVWVMGGRVSDFHVSQHRRAHHQRQAQLLDRAGPLLFPALLDRRHRRLRRRRACSRTWSHTTAGSTALIGATWAFHVSFTLWMIPKGQTDLTYYGTFFSLVVIYLMNLAVLTVLLVIASPHVTWRGFGLEWLRNAHTFARWVLVLARQARYALHPPN